MVMFIGDEEREGLTAADVVVVIVIVDVDVVGTEQIELSFDPVVPADVDSL